MLTSRAALFAFIFVIVAFAVRYTVDSSARLVPVGTAEKCKFSRQLVLDDKKGMHIPASASAPFTALAGVGHVPEENSFNNFGGLTSDSSDRQAMSSSVPSASGKASAKRAGGKLRPVTVHSALPRKRAPVIRRCERGWQPLGLSKEGAVVFVEGTSRRLVFNDKNVLFQHMMWVGFPAPRQVSRTSAQFDWLRRKKLVGACCLGPSAIVQGGERT